MKHLLRAYVADAMTLANGIFGFLAILTWSVELGPLSGLDDATFAGLCIGIGAVLDGLDGIVARRWGSTGLGNALDTMCDAITFCVAPAILLLQRHQYVSGTLMGTVAVGAAMMFLIAGILRLAREREREDASTFQGLPTPWSAAILTAALLLGWEGLAVLTGAVLLALLNVSRIPYPKSKGTMTAFALAALGVGVVVISSLFLFPESAAAFLAVALALGLLMVTFGPWFVRRAG